MAMRNWILAVGALALLFMAGCIIPGGNETSPTPQPTLPPNVTQTPPASPTATIRTPTPIFTPPANQTPAGCPASCRYGCVPGTVVCAEPGCPPSCLYGCEPNTTVCKQPVCPPSCQYGCISGTTTCKTVVVNVSMANGDFETGNYSGWNSTGSGWNSEPKSGSFMNSQQIYYSVPYSGWQGNYFATTYPERGAIGTLQSAPFTLNKKYIEFLVIGQEDTQICVGLKIEDESIDMDCDELMSSSSVVRLLYPSQPEVNPYSVFKRVAWDVSAYKGKQAVIEVVDNSVRGWIEVDDFRQTDTSSVTPLAPGHVAGYECNTNGLCEHGLGEYEHGCLADCPSPSSCRYTQWMAGPVDFTVFCHSFRLMPGGLFLYLRNTGFGRNHTILVNGVKCTAETAPDPSTYLPMGQVVGVGGIVKVSDGNMPCYGENGEVVLRNVGDVFSGKIYVDYEDTETHYRYFERLNFDAPVLPSLPGSYVQPNQTPTQTVSCVFPSGLSCPSFALHINGTLDLTLGQNRGSQIRIDEIACVPQNASEPDPGAYTGIGVVIPNGAERAVSGRLAHESVRCGSGGTVNATSSWRIWVKYNETATELRRQAVGEMTAKYEP